MMVRPSMLFRLFALRLLETIDLEGMVVTGDVIFYYILGFIENPNLGGLTIKSIAIHLRT